MLRHPTPPPLTRRRRWPLVPLALLVVLGSAPEAKAQWTVIDPVHIGKSVWNGGKIVEQLTTTRAQLQAFKDNVVKLASYNVRDVTGFVNLVDATLLSATDVAYNSASLVGDFDAFYRGADPSATAATTAAWVDGELDGALGTLRSIREHAVQIRAAKPDLARFQSQISSASTAQQVAEAQGTIQAYAVQESQLLRQATLLQIDQAARTQASAAARRAYVVEVGRTTRARTLASGGAMTGVDYNATGIF